MNRRRFLELLGMAAAGSGITYSFPTVIMPQNVVSGVALLSSPSFPIAIHETLLNCTPVSPSFPVAIGGAWAVFNKGDVYPSQRLIVECALENGTLHIPSFEIQSTVVTPRVSHG